MMDRRAILLGLAGASIAQAASAQQLPLIGGPGFLGAPLGAEQDDFRAMALMDGSFSIQTSTIALERSRDPRVQEFAQLEIEEQTAIAAALGTTPMPMPLRTDQADIVSRLQNTPARAFDASYVRGQIAGHTELLGVNSSYSREGNDPSERRVAILAVPTIRTHLAILHRLQGRATS